MVSTGGKRHARQRLREQRLPVTRGDAVRSHAARIQPSIGGRLPGLLARARHGDRGELVRVRDCADQTGGPQRLAVPAHSERVFGVLWTADAHRLAGAVTPGEELGLPREMVYRHPFPGPGLGVRILGEVRREYAQLLAKADHIFIEELRKADLYDTTSQAFAVFLPVRSVGVVGDQRAYEWVIALRAVETVDFMTAHWRRLPYDFLALVSTRIINELGGISRVVYDISGKPPATIEWE